MLALAAGEAARVAKAVRSSRVTSSGARTPPGLLAVAANGAADELDGAARMLRAVLAVIEADFSAVSAVLDINLEKLLPLVAGGFAETRCATSFARNWLSQRKHKADMPSVKGLAPGMAYVRAEAAAHASRMRASVDSSTVCYGASLANAVQVLMSESSSRSRILS